MLGKHNQFYAISNNMTQEPIFLIQFYPSHTLIFNYNISHNKYIPYKNIHLKIYFHI